MEVSSFCRTQQFVRGVILFVTILSVPLFGGSGFSVAQKSPTEAYLSDPSLQKVVDEYFGAYRKKTVLAALELLILKREKEYSADYCVFYHAQQGDFRIIHDFLKELYTILDGISHGDDYNYLRPRHTALDNINANDFIERMFFTYGYDGDMRLIPHMLSVNLSLFANSTNSSSCTYSYFISNTSAHNPNVKKILADICNHHSLQLSCVGELLALKEKIKSSEGTLFQICIPKDKVDRYVYLSYPGGRPYGCSVISDCFDVQKQRHTSILPILEQYCRNIAQIRYADMLQARIVFDKDFLNPASGIKVFRYTTVPADEMQAYRAELKEIVVKACHA